MVSLKFSHASKAVDAALTSHVQTLRNHVGAPRGNVGAPGMHVGAPRGNVDEKLQKSFVLLRFSNSKVSRAERPLFE